MNALEFAALGLTAIVVLALIYPRTFKLQRLKYVAQGLSFPAFLSLAAGALTLACLIIAVFSSVPFWWFEALLLAIYTLANTVYLYRLGFRHHSLPAQPDSLVVMGWNTLGDSVPVDYLRDAILNQRPDVVSLPETTREHTQALVAALETAGYPMRGYTVGPQDGHLPNETSLLINATHGEHHIERVNVLGASTLEAVPLDTTRPMIVAVHTVAPTLDWHGPWIENLQQLAKRYRGAHNTILVGDFNATTLHMADLDNRPGTLAGLQDAATNMRAAAIGTWPVKERSALGTQIDHVMHTGDFRTTGFRVLSAYDGSGSDHRAIIAELSRVED
jgi:endonuclease/exonuclease/phosphatase (EEP) superfamily protein YafD